MTEVSTRTGVPLPEIDADERLSRYGLDSVGATALLADLATHLGRKLSPTLFWHYPTVDALAGYLSSAGNNDAAGGETQAEALEPIAIVGMACRFPGAPDPAAFWELLRGGKDAIGEVPASRWDADAYYSPDPAAPGKMITRRGGFVNGVDQFDALFFSMSPREAAEVDPQQRLALEVCWEALEDAGVAADRLRGSRTGVFMGAIWHDYADLHRGARAAITAHTGLGQALDIIANRVSYVLGLQGPSIAIDTACSSSLVAIHLACQSLRSQESTLALAGGVSLMLSPDTMVALSKFGGLSPDGRSMAFDARANGFARGEGAGVVVLKRLSAALADGDPIYCVIRGSAVNNDGFSNGLSAPNPAAQESVLREAYRCAGVAPSQVHYIEAHGTGTALGDPIEARALGAVLGAGRPPDRPLVIGSVKTNIGHLEGASGIAGVIKTALAIRHRTIPASLHFEQPNPYIPFDELRVQVQRTSGPWPTEEKALAGVSSFGWGGTNCHIVLEGLHADAPVARRTASPAHAGLVFVCSPYGSQWPGMGRELMATEPVFRAKLMACDRALRPLTGWSVVEELASFHAGARWNDVSVVQPLLFAFQVALAAQWRAWGIVADAVVGHSLGEIAAAHIAGALSLEEAALVICHYSRLQAQQAGGGMAIVGLAAAELEADLARFGGRIVVAAHNSRRTTVLSGCANSLKSLLAELTARGVFCSLIDINVAAHSPDIDAIMDELRTKLAGILPRRPSIPMISTLTGEPVGEAPLDGDYWARNLRNPVQLAQAVAWLLKHGYGTFLELAPHPVMAHALMQSVAEAGRDAVVLPSCSRDEERRVMLETLAALPARTAPAERDRPLHILALSAKTGEALRELARRYAAILAEESLADICFTANTRRARFAQRLAVRAGSAAQMKEQLLAFAAGAHAEGVFSGDARRSPTEAPGEDLCERWVRGGNVDWTAYDRDYARRRVSVPSYPFQRSRCWFTPGEPAAPSLLGRRVRSALDQIQFEAELSPRSPAFLDGHRVRGTAVLPTAAYLDMALTAAGPGEYQVEAMTLQEPLSFVSEQARAVNLILDANRFRVYSQDAGGGAWTLHVDGKVRARDGVPAGGASLEEARERCRDAVDVDAWYQEFDRAGLHYGPAFQKVLRLWRGSGESLGEIAAPPGMGETATALDAALQVLFAALPARHTGDDLAVYLPISLEKFHLSTGRLARVWSHARVRPQDGDGRENFTADIRIFDEAGELVGELTGFHLRRARDSQQWTEWLYRVEWSAAETLSSADRDRYQELAPRLDELAGAYAADTLQQLGPEFQPGEPAHRRMLDLMRRMRKEDAFLPSVRDPRALAGAIRRDFPDCGAELTLLERCGERLADILTGKCEALQVLFPNGSLAAAEAFYADSLFSRAMNTLLRDAVEAAVAAAPAGRLRVLEIGAGTGSATSGILPLLPADRTEYVFTDVSPIFLAHGRDKFRAYPFVRCELLDIEREPAVGEGFDIVIAANVLHATADLRSSLGHIKRLLKPDGAVVMLEVTRRERWVDLVFGLTDGWWKFADRDLRPDHALLPARTWLRLLEEAGFGGANAAPESDTWGQAVLTARKPSEAARRSWWIFADAGGLGREVASLLDGCVLKQAGEVLEIPAGGIEGIIHLRALDCAGNTETSPATLEADEERMCRSVIEVVQALVKSGQPNRRGIWVITRGAQPVEADGAEVALAQSAVWGVGRVVANEHPEHWGGLIDLDPRDRAGDAKLIVKEVTRSRAAIQVAYRGGQRRAARLARVEAGSKRPGLRFRDDACYLISGGLGGLGLAMVPWMVERGARHVALAGRSGASAEAQRLLDGLNPAARVTVHRADVSREQDVEDLLADVAREHPPLAGVFHAAGVLHDAALLQQDWVRFQQVTAPKMLGAWNLHRLTAGMALDWFVLFSSQTALLGSAGQANHAAANAFLDALAHYRRAAGLPAISVNWGPWERVGAAVQANLVKRFAQHGIRYIEPGQALSAFEYLLEESPVQRAVMNVDWVKFAQTTAAGRSPMFEDLTRTRQHDPRPMAVERPPKAEDDIRARLRQGSLAERREAVLAHVREQAVRVLRLESAQPVDAEQPLIELGLDSLMAIELKNHIELQLGVAIPVVRILEGASPRQLAEQLMEQLHLDLLIDSVQAGIPPQAAEAEWDMLKL